MTGNEKVPPAAEDRGDHQNTLEMADLAAANSSVVAGQGTVDLVSCHVPNHPMPPAMYAHLGPSMGWPALAYARLGFRVHPVWWMNPRFGTCACPEGQYCLNPGKHPVLSGWPAAASTDPMTVANMWRNAHPMANVGVATGRGSDLIVIDLDVSETCELVVDGGGAEWRTTTHDGRKTFREYVDERGINVPSDCWYATPGGGVQLWYRPHPQWRGKLETLSGWLPGVDTRGDGGQVVVPPSFRFVDGQRRHYAWRGGCPCSLPTLPLALHEAMAQDGGGRGWSGSRAGGGSGDHASIKAGIVRDAHGLIDVSHYRSNGIPLGSQQVVLFHLANELLALGSDAVTVADTLWAIVQVSPYDPRRPRWERRHLARESSWESKGIVDRGAEWISSPAGQEYALSINDRVSFSLDDMRAVVAGWGDLR